MPDPKNVVIVEDDFLIAEYLSDLCDQFGVKVVGTAANASNALRVIADHKPDFILMDVRLQGQRDGVEVAEAVHANQPGARIIFITGSNEPETIARIRRDRPHRILIKPIDPGNLRDALDL